VHPFNFYVSRVWFFCPVGTVLLSSVHLSTHPAVFLLQLNNSLVVESSVQHCTNHEPVLSSPVLTTCLVEDRGGLSIRAALQPLHASHSCHSVFLFCHFKHHSFIA
jgi:hypothetical protein